VRWTCVLGCGVLDETEFIEDHVRLLHPSVYEDLGSPVEVDLSDEEED